MMSLLKQSLIFTFALVTCIQHANSAELISTEENPWEIVQEEDGIVVYAINTEKSTRFRAVGLIEVKDPFSLVALMNDYKNFQRWSPTLSKLTELHKDDELNRYMRAIISLPILQEREVIFKISISQDPISNAVTILFKNQPDYLPINGHYIRVPIFDGLMRYDAVSNTEIKVTYEIEINISGSAPANLINYLTKYTPYMTVQGLRKEVDRPEYHNRGADFPYLKFPKLEPL